MCHGTGVLRWDLVVAGLDSCRNVVSIVRAEPLVVRKTSLPVGLVFGNVRVVISLKSCLSGFERGVWLVAKDRLGK